MFSPHLSVALMLCCCPEELFSAFQWLARLDKSNTNDVVDTKLGSNVLTCSPAGRAEEPPSSVSSPISDTPLDSPLSCGDITLESTGELTVEDVRDFLT